MNPKIFFVDIHYKLYSNSDFLAFRVSCCSISLGYAGLWECVYALNGKKLTEHEGEELGLEIMRKLNEYTAKWKAAENIDYSLRHSS